MINADEVEQRAAVLSEREAYLSRPSIPPWLMEDAPLRSDPGQLSADREWPLHGDEFVVGNRRFWPVSAFRGRRRPSARLDPCCQSSFQARRREADIGSRADARFLDIGFVPEADARHPTLPEKFIAQFVLFYGK
jgi:hypothetical protein